MKKVYISGALTGVENLAELKNIYESLGRVCGSIGLTPYIPHLHTDPHQHPNITPKDVFNLDREHVHSSDLLVAYVGTPSFGVGMEISFAHEIGIPVILIYEDGKVISRLIRGVPNLIHEIVFHDHQSLYKSFKEIVQDVLIHL